MSNLDEVHRARRNHRLWSMASVVVLMVLMLVSAPAPADRTYRPAGVVPWWPVLVSVIDVYQ